MLKVADFNLPHLHLMFPLGVTHSNFEEIFSIEKIGSCAIVWLYLHDSTFRRFETIPACDRRTDTRRRLILR